MAKLTQEELVNAIAELTVLELSELVKAIEEKFGVKAAIMVGWRPATRDDRLARR